MMGFIWDRLNGWGVSKLVGLFDTLGVQINPATEEKQDEIITALGGGIGATSLSTGSKDVTTAGTRVPLNAVTTFPMKRITIRAKYTNTGYIFIGGNSVSSTSGLFLGPGDSVVFSIPQLMDIYIDSSVNGEGIVWTAEL